jgi:hypothetical protein
MARLICRTPKIQEIGIRAEPPHGPGIGQGDVAFEGGEIMAGRAKSKTRTRAQTARSVTKSKTRSRAQAAARTVKRTAKDVVHTGERAAAGIERQMNEAGAVASAQLEQAAGSMKPVANAMAYTGQQYLAWTSQITRGSLKLAGERYRHNMEFARSLARCRDWSEAVSLQRNWALQAMEDYIGQTADLARVATPPGLGGWQPLLPPD